MHSLTLTCDSLPSTYCLPWLSAQITHFITRICTPHLRQPAQHVLLAVAVCSDHAHFDSRICTPHLRQLSQHVLLAVAVCSEHAHFNSRICTSHLRQLAQHVLLAVAVCSAHIQGIITVGSHVAYHHGSI